MSDCDGAVEWARTQPSYAVAWRRCQRPDWLLWLAGRCGHTLTQRRAIVLAACDCAETALRHVPEGELRPAEAIRVARAWCRGKATLQDVRAATNAAYAASAAATNAATNAAAAASAADDAAAYAAAYTAAYAANAAAYAANAAAYAANAAAYAANAAAYADADAASYAANAADAAADADAAYDAVAAARGTTREAARRKCSGLIHARIPRPTLPPEATRCTGAMY
jgi:hypothetical protein